MKLFACFVLALLYSTPGWAITYRQNAAPDTLLLTVINHTGETLDFIGMSSLNPGNTFQLTSPAILPGGEITITATATALADIRGHLLFRDAKGNRHTLNIQDPLQIHAGSHVARFSMDNEKLVSFVHARTLNPDNQTRHLVWSAATLEIENRIRV